MDSLLSFPVGLFHPLQHAGLSRRSPVGRPSTHNHLCAAPVPICRGSGSTRSKVHGPPFVAREDPLFAVFGSNVVALTDALLLTKH